MNKAKFLRIAGIIITVVVLATSAVVWSFSPKSESEQQIGITYEDAMKSQKPFIVLFYADWCTYCMRFMPTYRALSKIYGDNYNFVMVNGDVPANINLIQNYAIGGFPTIYIVDPVIDNRILISNTLYDSYDKLRVEFDRYLRIRSMIKF